MRPLGIALLAAVLAIAVFAIPASQAQPVASSSSSPSAVFVLSNGGSGNHVIAYDRAANGTLTWAGNFSTGGNGTGASLASQGALAVTADHHWLLAVDAGSDQISVFRIGSTSPLLALTDVVSSGGIMPVSLTVSGHWVYVLNDGGSGLPGTISGFSLNSSGILNPLAGSTQPLSTSSASGAAQISFNPTGSVLLVTEKNTNMLDSYRVNAKGVAWGLKTHVSQGTTPYGFAFAPNGAAIVSNAASNSLSSYAVYNGGNVHVRSNSVPDYQTAPCWVVLTGGGHYAFTSDGHSNAISSYVVEANGKIVLLQSLAASTGAGPNDVAIAPGSHLLYVYDAGAGNIEGYWIHANGTLSWVDTTGGLPAGAQGLVSI
jgi:6-phosphogluconolactonase